MLLVALGIYARHAIRQAQRTRAAIPNLVAITLERLANQATMHAQDVAAGIDASASEPWVAIGQLRDDVLRDEHSPKRREHIWAKVRRVVEMNANVRASQRESRSGEVSRVWEWIGALGAEDGIGIGSGVGVGVGVGGAEGRARRKSGRVSWGEFGKGSPVSGTDGGPEVVQMRWAEARPVY